METPKSGIDLNLEDAADAILRADAKSVNPDTGKPRTIGGENPILFKEHIWNRKKREISPTDPNTNGIVDPSIQRGIYNRQHAQGRRVNSLEARKRNGSSYYA